MTTDDNNNDNDADLDLALTSLVHTTVSGVTESARRAVASLVEWRDEQAAVELLHEVLSGVHEPGHPLCLAGQHLPPVVREGAFGGESCGWWMAIADDGVGEYDDVITFSTPGGPAFG